MASLRQRYTRKKAVPFVMFAAVLWSLAAYIISGHGYYRHLDSWALSPSFLLDLKQLVGLQNFYSQYGQDKWILGKVFPGVKSGYFVDIGSWDAETKSNSKGLEELGWTGICVDPFPRNWKNRKCQLFEEVVYSKKGERIKFRMAGIEGGIETHLGASKNQVGSFASVELTTTTIGDILRRANAPRLIHYVSIDTEGSELEILKVFPFSQYTVGAFTIEHNFEEPRRHQIRELLQREGYRFVKEQIVDDFYILAAKDRLADLKATGR